MKPMRARARLLVGSLAAVGVVAAHWLAYRLAAPDPHLRAELLESTGHRYFSLFSALVLGVFAAAVTGSILARLSRRRARSRRSSGAALAGQLAVVQAAGWLALEGAERVLVAHHHSSMFAEPVLWIGLALQMVVAVASALLFVVAELAIESILSIAGPPSHVRRSRSWPVVTVATPRAGRRAEAWSSRGPPAIAAL